MFVKTNIPAVLPAAPRVGRAATESWPSLQRWTAGLDEAVALADGEPVGDDEGDAEDAELQAESTRVIPTPAILAKRPTSAPRQGIGLSRTGPVTSMVDVGSAFGGSAPPAALFMLRSPWTPTSRVA